MANWVGQAANLAVMFFLSPFIVHSLGAADYGIWSLLLVLTGYMGILDMGVRASTGRHIVLYLGKEDHAAVDQTIRAGLGFYTVFSLFMLAIGVGVGWAFPTFFPSVQPRYHGLVRVLLPLMAVNIWMSACGAVFSSVLTAHERFDLTRTVDLIVLGFRTVATVAMLKLGYGLVGLTAAIIGSSLAGLIGNWAVAGRVYPRLRSWPVSLSRDRLRELLGYGVLAFISTVSFTVMGQADSVIVGACISVSAVTTYSVGAMPVFYSWNFVSQINATFFPSLQQAIAKGDMAQARWLWLRQVRLGLLVGLPIYIGLAVFALPFVRLWMGGPAFPESAVREAASVAGVLGASRLLLVISAGCGSFLAAQGHMRFVAVAAVAEAALGLTLSLVFLLRLRWGLMGVAAGPLVARCLVGAMVWPWYTCRKARMALGAFALHVAVPGASAAILLAAWYLPIRALFAGDSWLCLGGQLVLALVGTVPVLLLLLTEGGDRKRLCQFLRIRAGGLS